MNRPAAPNGSHTMWVVTRTPLVATHALVSHSEQATPVRGLRVSLQRHSSLPAHDVPGTGRLCPGLFPLARRKLGNGGRSGPGKSSTNGWRLTGNRNRVPDNPAQGADTDETTPTGPHGCRKPEVRTAPTGRIPICISIFRHIGRFRYRLLVSCWYIW